MEATQQLRDEHEGIKLMLRILEAVSKKAASGAPVPQKDLDAIAEFLSAFADKCHHGKEEEYLFPALERVGIPRHGGPIGVMLQEHDHGREIIARLKEAFSEYGSGGKGAGAEIAKAAGEYVALLTEHIEKENEVLFRMAEARIGKDEDACLVDAFENPEHATIKPCTLDEIHAMI